MLIPAVCIIIHFETMLSEKGWETVMKVEKIFIRQRLKKIINNMPMAHKIQAVILVGSLVIAGFSFLAIQIVDYSYKKLLYQALTESISYSSKEISDYLQDMENLTMMILSDGNIQSALWTLQEQPEDSLAYMSALQTLSSSVGGFYQSSSDGILRYITIYADTFAISSNRIRADETPDELQEMMITGTEEKDGGVFWITEYSNSYGLFQGRSIKKIDMLGMEPMGTILLNVDMDALISKAVAFGKQYDETAYVIRNSGNLLYHTDNLSAEEARKIGNESGERYQVTEQKEHSWFTVHGKIPGYGWDYYCLVSYDKIAASLFAARITCAAIILADMFAVIAISGKLIERMMWHVSRLKDRMQQFAADNTKVPQVEYDYSDRNDEAGVLHRQFDVMSRTIIDLIQENYVNELLKKEAQLKALENQINPHFLYNTLGSIKWRAKAAGKQDISDMVDALGGLLRVSLSKEDDRDYTLRKELEVIRSYITIQKLRYEERLLFRLAVPTELETVRILKLTVQPLVENAVYYGVESNVEDCEILLSARADGNILHIYVKNTGSEFEPDLLECLETGKIRPHGNGIGLLNISKRVCLQYGESYGLKFYNEGEYAVSELTIPMSEGEEKE